MQEYNTKKRVFEDWFNAAMQRAPLSIFCNKIEKARRRIILRVGFQKALEMAVHDEELCGLSLKH